MSDERVPVGTKVQYHGSITEMHGEYTVEATGPGMRVIEGRYHLWPVGVPHKWGYVDRALYNVRRQSFTVIE